MAKITNRDLDRMVDNAQQAFWTSVAKDAKKFGITTGDLDPGITMKFDDACFKVVEAWVNTNLNESSQLDNFDESIKSFAEFTESSQHPFQWFGIVQKPGFDLPTAKEAKYALELSIKKNEDYYQSTTKYVKDKFGLTPNRDNGYGAIVAYLEQIAGVK